jgi:hypothetical protein
MLINVETSKQYATGEILNRMLQMEGYSNARTASEQLGINHNSARRCLSIYRSHSKSNVSLTDIKDDRPQKEITDEALENLLELARLTQIEMMKIDPVITHLEIDLRDAKGPQAFLLAGCMQTGGRWTWHDFIRQQLQKAISHPSVWIGFFGDDIENFKSGTFAGAMSQYEQALQPPLQRRAWELFLDTVKNRVKWAMWSQHGTIWDARDGFTYIKDLYLKRNIPFFDGFGYIKLQVGKQEYQVAVSHEFPGSSMYNKTHAQKRALWTRFPLADVIAQADKHQYAISEEDVYGLEVAAGSRKSPYVHLVQIGTAKAGPDKYTIQSWEPGTAEWPWMVLYPDRHLVKMTRHFEDVMMWVGDEQKPDTAKRKAA